MRRLELEAEERRREAKDERMMWFLAGLMQSSAGGYARPPYQQGNTNHLHNVHTLVEMKSTLLFFFSRNISQNWSSTCEREKFVHYLIDNCISQNNPTPGCVVNGTGCYDSWLWVFYYYYIKCMVNIHQSKQSLIASRMTDPCGVRVCSGHKVHWPRKIIINYPIWQAVIPRNLTYIV